MLVKKEKLLIVFISLPSLMLPPYGGLQMYKTRNILHETGQISHGAVRFSWHQFTNTKTRQFGATAVFFVWFFSPWAFAVGVNENLRMGFQVETYNSLGLTPLPMLPGWQGYLVERKVIGF